MKATIQEVYINEAIPVTVDNTLHTLIFSNKGAEIK